MKFPLLNSLKYRKRNKLLQFHIVHIKLGHNKNSWQNMFTKNSTEKENYKLIYFLLFFFNFRDLYFKLMDRKVDLIVTFKGIFLWKNKDFYNVFSLKWKFNSYRSVRD